MMKQAERLFTPLTDWRTTRSPASASTEPGGPTLNRFSRLSVWLMLTAWALGANLLTAQPSHRPKTLGPKWVSLFNGNDLGGWREIGRENWTVEDGAIHGMGVTDEYGYLATRENLQGLSPFSALQMRGRRQIAASTCTPNLAAIRRTLPPGARSRSTAASVITRGGIYGDGKGWIVWPAPELKTVIKPFDWNDLLIKVEGNRYRTYLNGVRMIDYTYPSPGSTEGVIALQLHSGGEGRMRFKDIWLRDLTGP